MSSASTFVDKVIALRPDFVGQGEKEKAALRNLVSEASGLAADLQALDAKLTPLTYLHSAQPTIADVALYTELHGKMRGMDSAGYYAVPAVTRYFNHIQHLQPIFEARTLLCDTSYTLVEFDLDNMPSLPRKVEVKEKKVKKGANSKEGEAPTGSTGEAAAKAQKTVKKQDAPSDVPAASVSETVSATQTQQPKQKKDKKEKVAPNTEQKKSKNASSTEVTGPMPSMIDLRVGKVLEVSRHPDADSLYVEQIDIGEETGPRTVCSGLVKYMKEEDILGQSLVIVCNLKPASMRGIKSFAMLLCASSADGKDGGLEFVKPPHGSQPGERIYFEGDKYEGQTPEVQLNPKKKIFEAIQPNFTTLDTFEACWIDPETKTVHKIRTKDGVCKVQSLVGASLS